MKDGITLLGFVAQEGRLELVRCLLSELGADINKTGKIGAKPPYYTVEAGHIDVVRCLVEKHGADVKQAAHSS